MFWTARMGVNKKANSQNVLDISKYISCYWCFVYV